MAASVRSSRPRADSSRSFDGLGCSSSARSHRYDFVRFVGLLFLVLHASRGRSRRRLRSRRRRGFQRRLGDRHRSAAWRWMPKRRFRRRAAAAATPPVLRQHVATRVVRGRQLQDFEADRLRRGRGGGRHRSGDFRQRHQRNAGLLDLAPDRSLADRFPPCRKFTGKLPGHPVRHLAARAQRALLDRDRCAARRPSRSRSESASSGSRSSARRQTSSNNGGGLSPTALGASTGLCRMLCKVAASLEARNNASPVKAVQSTRAGAENVGALIDVARRR